MNTNTFEGQLKERLDPKQIAKMQKYANHQTKYLLELQKVVAEVVGSYMKKEDICVFALAAKLRCANMHIHKILKGEANLTFTSVARLAAVMNKKVSLVFKD